MVRTLTRSRLPARAADESQRKSALRRDPRGVRPRRSQRRRPRVLVGQALAYRRRDGAIVKLGEQTRLSIKIGEPIWARVGEERLCTQDAIDLDDLEELERRGVSFARVLAPAQQVAS